MMSRYPDVYEDRSDRRYADRGTAVHNTLQAIYEGNDLPDVGPLLSDDRMRQEFDDSLKGWELLAETYKLEAGKDVYVEQALEHKVAGITLVGRVDFMDLRDGIVRIVDWKTGAPSQECDRQGRIYQYLARRRYEHPIMVYMAHLRETPPILSKVSYVGDSIVESWILDMISKINRYELAGEFPCTVNSDCKLWCGYRHCCPRWQK